MASFAFWAAALLLGYTYLGYPAIVWLWSRLDPRIERRGGRPLSVSIVTVAQNEASRIRERVAELLALDYPPELVEIVIASDGSTDTTVRRALGFGSDRVKVLDFPRARGKAATLADAVEITRGEILVFCDVRQTIERGALRALLAPFADGQVGAVSGSLVFGDPRSPVGLGMGIYWRLETFVRACESRIDSMCGATGALYALRRELFQAPPAGTLLDDVWIPYQAVRRGYRVLFEPTARAFDEAPRSSRHELARKVRTLAGCLQLFARERWLFDPRRNRIWLQTLSHKGLRLLGPMFLLIALVASALADEPIYRVAFGLQLGFYAMAATAMVFRRRSGLLAVPYTFCLLQAAVLLAFARFVTGSQSVLWKGQDHAS